jgi:hypothetical protein
VSQKRERVLLCLNARSLAISAGLLIIVLVLGYAVGALTSRPDQRRAEALGQQLKTVEQRLTIAELRGTVGLMAYEANRNNYTEAAKYSTEFFDGVRTAMEQSDSENVKVALGSLLARRDEITRELARTDPAVKEKLMQMYINFFQIHPS